MKLVALAFALALAALPALAQALYTPPEGDFSIGFPSPPLVTVQPPKRFADVALRRYVVSEPSRALVLAVEEYPDQSGLPQPTGGVYDRILRSHAPEDGPLKLISTRPARLAGRPSMEGAYADSDSGGIELVRILIVGNRLYRLSYLHGPDANDAAAVDAFFASFKLN